MFSNVHIRYAALYKAKMSMTGPTTVLTEFRRLITHGLHQKASYIVYKGAFVDTKKLQDPRQKSVNSLETHCDEATPRLIQIEVFIKNLPHE